MKLIEHKVTLRPIDANRWNTLLGLEKGTQFKVIPNMPLGAIYVRGRVRAIHSIETEESPIELHVFEGIWEIVNN